MSAVRDQIALSKSQMFATGAQGRQVNLRTTVGYMSLTSSHALLPFPVAGQCLSVMLVSALQALVQLF